MNKTSGDLKVGDVVKAPAVYEDPYFVFIGRGTDIAGLDSSPVVGEPPRHLYPFLFQFPSGQCTVMHIPLDYPFEVVEE